MGGGVPEGLLAQLAYPFRRAPDRATRGARDGSAPEA